MNRPYNILERIILGDKPVSIAELAIEFNISEKTVRNDLDSLDPLLKKYQLELIRKPGVGTYLDGNNDNKQKMIKFLQNQVSIIKDSPEERQNKILLQLLLSNKVVLIKELSIDYYVSRSTISKDLVALGHKLLNYNLGIENSKIHGLEITGSEIDKRKALSNLLPINLMLHELNGDKILNRLSNSSIIYNLNNLIDIDFNDLELILHESELMLGYSFSTETFVNLLIHLAIAIKRSQSGSSIELTDELKKELQLRNEFKIAKSTAQKIERKYNIILGESEIYYILLHFLGAKTINNNLDLDFKINRKEGELEKAIVKLIKGVQRDLNLYLEEDNQLFNSLMLHLKPTINRIIYDLSLQNPLKKEIIRDYFDIYNAILNNIDVLNKSYKIKMPDDEIAYLVLHFGAARERAYKKTRVIIVCASGIGIAQLISSKLEKLFRNIEIVDVVSVIDLKNYNYENIDLIISTIDLGDFHGIKTIFVNSLLTDFDILNIRKHLNQNILDDKLSNFFNSNIIFDIDKRINKEEVLIYLNNKLMESNKVRENYLDSLIEREKAGSTHIGYGVAVVHGSPNEVRESFIQIVRLKHPIVWHKDETVNFIINFLSTVEDSNIFTNLFKQIGKSLDNELLWNKIKSIKCKEELCIFLNKELLQNDNK